MHGGLRSLLRFLGGHVVQVTWGPLTCIVQRDRLFHPPMEFPDYDIIALGI